MTKYRLTPSGIFVLAYAASLSFLALIFAGCSNANASTLRVEYFGDSARVILQWGAGCDARGCPDTYTSTFRDDGGALVSTLQTKTRQMRADTLVVARPLTTATETYTGTVSSTRRGLVGPSTTVLATVTRRDIAPPLVDSVRVKVDTVAAQYVLDSLIAVAAENDSFPVRVIRSSEVFAGPNPFADEGAHIQLCALSRNRYTGEVVVLLDAHTSTADEILITNACEPARLRYLAERNG